MKTVREVNNVLSSTSVHREGGVEQGGHVLPGEDERAQNCQRAEAYHRKRDAGHGNCNHGRPEHVDPAEDDIKRTGTELGKPHRRLA